MKKRFLSLLLTGALLLSVTACGSGTDNAPASRTGEESAQETQSEPESEQESQKTEVQTQESGEPITLTIANVGSSQPYPNGESAEDNWWTRQYKERFNVDVKTEWYTNDGDSYNTKLNMAIVSKSIPDAFTATSLRQLK